jgi:hypothetical protein
MGNAEVLRDVSAAVNKEMCMRIANIAFMIAWGVSLTTSGRTAADDGSSYQLDVGSHGASINVPTRWRRQQLVKDGNNDQFIVNEGGGIFAMVLESSKLLENEADFATEAGRPSRPRSKESA